MRRSSYFKIRVRVSALLMWCLVLLGGDGAWSAQEGSCGRHFQTEAPIAILYDMSTGTVLLEKDADKEMIPSSMTKALLVYVIFEKLEKGELKETDLFSISAKARHMGGSRMFVNEGDQVSLDALLRGVIVQSGNDACVALAEGISGSEAAFVDLMNQKAEEIGAKTKFLNSTGWPDPGHVCTARDLLMIGIRTIKDFPDLYRRYYSQRSFAHNNINQMNRNPLLSSGVGDGLKTGRTEDGGFGFLGSGQSGDRRLVFVVNGLPTEKKRTEASLQLLKYGFAGFEVVALYPADVVVGEIDLSGATVDRLPLVSSVPIRVTIPRGCKDHIQKTVEPICFKLPLQKGEQAGVLRVRVPGIPEMRFPLQADFDVQECGFFGNLWKRFKASLMGQTKS